MPFSISETIKKPLFYLLAGAALPSLILAYMFFSGPAKTPEPVNPGNPRIIGTEEGVPLGELVKLKVIPYDKKPEGFKSHVVKWKIFDGDVEKKLENSEADDVVFGTGVVPKKLKVMCAVAQLFEDGSVKLFFLISDLHIGSNPTPVPPGPVPPIPPVPVPPVPPVPDVDPVFPDGKFKLAVFSYDTAKNKVTSPMRKKEAEALSSSFNSVASAIAAGTIKTLEDALKICTESNTKALAAISPDSAGRWNTFATILQEKMYKLYSERGIRNVQDLREAFVEISQGLSKIK